MRELPEVSLGDITVVTEARSGARWHVWDSCAAIPCGVQCQSDTVWKTPILCEVMGHLIGAFSAD